MNKRDEIVAAVREGWPEYSDRYYPARGYWTAAPPVQDGGMTARLIDYAVDMAIEMLACEDKP